MKDNPLSQFVVRTEDLSYDNEYNDAMIQAEKRQRLQEAAQTAIETTLTYSINIARRAGLAALNGLETYIQSASRS